MTEADWAQIMPNVARQLLGEPARIERGGTQWRYGNHGSLSITVGGDRPGVWRDHSSGSSGGTLALVEYILQTNRKGALSWLRDNHFISGDAQSRARTDPQRDTRVRAERERQQNHEREWGQKRAAVVAQQMIGSASLASHPYLKAKGFGDREGLVLDGSLLVPMRELLYGTSGAVWAVQAIDAQGGKKFQPGGCRAADTVHILGHPSSPLWIFCEGFATGLSIREALESRSVDHCVIVAFSSGQLASVAARQSPKRIVVVTDHDWWRCRHRDCKAKWDYPSETCPECELATVPPAGETAARKSGRPWWQPPEPGTDANDLSREQGAAALAAPLLKLIWGGMIG